MRRNLFQTCPCKQRKDGQRDKKSKDGGIYETTKVLVQALALALIVRTLLFQPFNIPSGSMMDTLLIGDYLFVSKYSYGYSQYSFPYGLIPIEGRIWAEEPERSARHRARCLSTVGPST